MSVSLVSTLGYPVNYITLAELKQSPIYNQLKRLVPGQSDADRDAELLAIIRRATGMINDYVNQNLAASVDTEIGRVVVSNDGDLRLHTRSRPIVQVLSVSVGQDPGNLHPLADLTNVVIDPWRITIPRCGHHFRPGQRLWAQWSYINGFPVTQLTEPASPGDTTITVSTTTGIIPNPSSSSIPGTPSQVTIQDGRLLEVFFPTAVEGNTLTVPPLLYAHQVGTGVTSLPDGLKEVALLLISRLHDTWSLTMNVISTDGGGSKKPKSGPAVALCDAGNILLPYKRVW